MTKPQESLSVFFVVMDDEVVRTIIHQLHQLPALVDDGCAVAPGEDGCEEAGDLDVRLPGECMWDADRVAGNERWTIVFIHLSIQECAKILACCRHLVVSLPDGFAEIFYQVVRVFDAHA